MLLLLEEEMEGWDVRSFSRVWIFWVGLLVGVFFGGERGRWFDDVFFYIFLLVVVLLGFFWEKGCGAGNIYGLRFLFGGKSKFGGIEDRG